MRFGIVVRVLTLPAQRIETEEQRIADLADGVRAQLDRLSEAAADVPKPLRPKLPDFDRLAKLRPEEMSTGPTQRLAQEAKARLAKLGRTGKQLERARPKVERARGARVALEERVTNEVALPATSNRAELLRAGDRLSEVASSLDRSFEPPAIDDDASIAALLQATRDLTASQAQLLRRAEKLVKAQTGLADREAEILASVLEQAGATDVETVQGLAVEAEVAASTAKTALESAKEGARRAKSLDDQLSVGSELVDDLARLMALLTNSQFIGELASCRPNSRNRLWRSHRVLLTGVAVSSSSFLSGPPIRVRLLHDSHPSTGKPFLCLAGFSRSSSRSRVCSSVVGPGRAPPSTSARRTHFRNVSGVIPNFEALSTAIKIMKLSLS